MKKPGFIITETIFSLVLAASVAAVSVLAIDLKTNQFHLDRFNPFAASENENPQEEKKESSRPSEESSAPEQSSAPETSQEESSPEESSADSSEPVSEPETSQESSEPSKPDDPGKTIQLRAEPANLKTQPKELVTLLKKYGYSLENAIDGNKIIMVDTSASGSDRTKAVVYCYQKSDKTNYWWNVVGDNMPICEEAYIGENGSNFEPKRDSKVTPGGVFRVIDGFYIKDKPNTTYSMFEITENTYWVTDPDSKFYNQKVEGTEKKDWKTADHMITSEKPYKYGLVLNYNTSKPDKTKACAIFIHCGNAPTEGSIALPEDVMKTIVEWMDDGTRMNVFVAV